MPPIVQDAVNHLKRRYPEIPDAAALDFVREAHRVLVARVPGLARLAHSAPVAFNTVAGTKEYALSPALSQVDAVYMGGIQLQPSSVERLNTKQWGWRTRAQLGPTDSVAGTVWYVSAEEGGGQVVGFHPTPGATHAVKVWGSREPASFTGSTPLPAQAGTVMPWVDGASWLAALVYRPAAADAHAAAFDGWAKFLSGVVATAAEPDKASPALNFRSGTGAE